MLHTADYLEKTDFALDSSQTLCYASRTQLWRWEGANIPIPSAWRLLPARYGCLQAARLISLVILWMGHFFCAPSNSAAENGIYFFKVAASIMSDTRGIHFLGLTSRAMVSHLLSAIASTRVCCRIWDLRHPQFSELGFLKAVFISD